MVCGIVEQHGCFSCGQPLRGGVLVEERGGEAICWALEGVEGPERLTGGAIDIEQPLEELGGGTAGGAEPVDHGVAFDSDGLAAVRGGFAARDSHRDGRAIRGFVSRGFATWDFAAGGFARATAGREAVGDDVHSRVFHWLTRGESESADRPREEADQPQGALDPSSRPEEPSMAQQAVSRADGASDAPRGLPWHRTGLVSSPPILAEG